MEIPHITEEYFCVHCDKTRSCNYVFKTWNRPVCKNKVHIRIITHDKDNACYRIFPSELNVNDLVLTHRENECHSILGIIDLNNLIQFNLENHGRWKTPKDRYVLKVDGGWYH